MKMIVDDGVKKKMVEEEKKEKTEDLEKEQEKTVKGGKVKDKDMAEAIKVA